MVVGELAEGGRVRLRAVNACLAFLPILDGKALYTVESLKRGERPNPGSTIGRQTSAPEGGPLTLLDVPGE